MNITVFGASGGIGGYVTALAEDPDAGPLRTPVITAGPSRGRRNNSYLAQKRVGHVAEDHRRP